ncbi:unnamed protein product [Caenorhabditis brenneri]
MDRSHRVSMKNAACCVTYHELQTLRVVKFRTHSTDWVTSRLWLVDVSFEIVGSCYRQTQTFTTSFSPIFPSSSLPHHVTKTPTPISLPRHVNHYLTHNCISKMMRQHIARLRMFATAVLLMQQYQLLLLRVLNIIRTHLKLSAVFDRNFEFGTAALIAALSVAHNIEIKTQKQC